MAKSKNPEMSTLTANLVGWPTIVLLIWCMVKFGFIYGLFVFAVLSFALAIALFALFDALNKPKVNAALEVMERELPAEIEKHSHLLRRNIQAAVIKNDYGKVLSNTTDEKIIEFLESAQISFDWKLIQSQAIGFTKTRLGGIEEQLASKGFDPYDLPTDGIEFEYWCADKFRMFGWYAEVTKSGGDQGIDVLVGKNGVKVGIQAKLYSSPVGNKAVQEAHAGKVFYGLDRVAVLTNAGYTKSAVELAETGGVILMSHFDIPKADELFL